MGFWMADTLKTPLSTAKWHGASSFIIMAQIEKYDVIVIGAGPVGLLTSVCLSRWGYKVKNIDNRPVPTATGRADGIQPRTLEMLRNMGLKRKIMAADPARVYEVAFWDPAPGGKIIRTGTYPSCPSFIDARYPFTALLHQGLIERVMIEDLEKTGTTLERPATITRFETNNADPAYPVEVDLKNLDSNVITTYRTKYLFSGEGARSFVREQLQVQIRHKDPISYVWGVMDGVLRTNFPDIKMKCTIHSDHGSIMVIPRENNMVRLYIQIASSTDKDFNPRKTATVQEVQAAAQRILQPYTCEWDRVAWYSVYPIGQGLADRYTLDNRVFMGGDVCHTHSPKAGQGMNTAFHDAVNFAWKIHHVESGFADRSILETYETERRAVAETLLNFDNKYAALFSKTQQAQHGDSTAEQQAQANQDFINLFKENCEFTSGFGVAYAPNILNYSPSQSLPNLPSELHSLIISDDNARLRPGRVMPNSNVTRVVDANKVHLENEIPFNGSFRLFVYAGSNTSPKPNQHPLLTTLSNNLLKPGSFYSHFMHHNHRQLDTHHDSNNPHSPFFSVALTLCAKRPEIKIEELPELFQAYRDRVYADDAFNEPVLNATFGSHAKVGLVQNDSGEQADAAVVVVRPDGHLAIAVRLMEDEGTTKVLQAYFDQFTKPGEWDGKSGSSRTSTYYNERGQNRGLHGGTVFAKASL
ncbi:hypothetical protein LTR64_003228 [Lithohypha guttulata]|uniref:uncharacterized protein n=1 Tax=Lithohypha guttulata TaxID=1690604 RepID=UPI002DDE6DBC|nr:hypothetical protein LTR51_000550 [Lithohypha guttulata]